MAPLAITSRHHRYTAGTHLIAEWLVATSLANGFSLRRLQRESVASEGSEFGGADYLVPVRLYQLISTRGGIGELFITDPSIIASVLPKPDPDDFQEARFSFIELIQDLITMASSVKKTLEAESAVLFNEHGGAIKLIESFYVEGREGTGEVANQMKELYAIYGLLLDCRTKANGEDVLKCPPDWVLTSEADITESQNGSQSQRIHILRLLPAMFLLCRNVQSELAIDSFTKLLGQLLLWGHMSISVLLATKVYIDICETLEDQLGCGFEILGRYREGLYKTVTETLNLNKQVKFSDWPEKSDESLVRLGRKVDFWVTRDPVAQTGKKTSWKLAPNILPQRHPLLCGVLLAQIFSESHSLGIDYANASGAVLRMAHLYHAARVSHYLDTAWPQMERVMAVQRTQALFVGSERPTDPKQVFPRYNLATGASIVIFSQGKRRAGNPRSKLPKVKLKRLQSGTPVLISLSEHLQAVSKNPANAEFPRTIAAITRGPTSKAVPLAAALESLANAIKTRCDRFILAIDGEVYFQKPEDLRNIVWKADNSERHNIRLPENAQVVPYRFPEVHSLDDLPDLIFMDPTPHVLTAEEKATLRLRMKSKSACLDLGYKDMNFNYTR
ncbi:hypothetical protein DL767_011270 [Monosporascus sp. MG133]|nr:hypothetical protein DL767_011270 [Monosporascus sp. MG133]